MSMDVRLASPLVSTVVKWYSFLRFSVVREVQVFKPEIVARWLVPETSKSVRFTQPVTSNDV
jgi:hypothetical protein